MKRKTTTVMTVPTAVSTSTTTAKIIVHNKKLPVQKISRTKMVQMLNDSKGRFFTSTHIDKDNNPRTMNCIKRNTPPTDLGYITVYSMVDKGLRNINPQTITNLSINGTHYVAKK
jgi:hypothetical protein